MNKNFAWVGSSIVLGTLLAGSVEVGGAIAVPFPSEAILREVNNKFYNSEKIPILIPADVPTGYTSYIKDSVTSSPWLGGDYIIFLNKKNAGWGGDQFVAKSGGKFRKVEKGEKVTSVTLENGVQGRYVHFRSKGGALEWRDSNVIYVVYLKTGNLETATTIANSAIQAGIRNPDARTSSDSKLSRRSSVPASQPEATLGNGNSVSSDMSKPNLVQGSAIESLPDGDYRYRKTSNIDEILRFRKKGKMISAWRGSLTELDSCLVGEVEGNSIVRGFTSIQGYGRKSTFDFIKQPIDLSGLVPLTLQDAEKRSDAVSSGFIKNHLQNKILRGCETRVDVLTDRFTAAYGAVASVNTQIDTPKSDDAKGSSQTVIDRDEKAIPTRSVQQIAPPLPKTAGTARPPSPQDIALLDRTIRDQKPKPKVADRTHMKPFTNNLLKPFVGAWTSADNQQYFVYPGKGRKTCIIVENGSTQNLQFGIAVGNATGTDMNVGTGRMFKTKNDGVLALRTPDSDRLVPLYAAAITTDLTDGNREAMKDNGCMTGFPGLPAGGTNSPKPFPSDSRVCPKDMFPATVDPVDPKYNHQSPSHAFVETAGIFKNGTTKDGRKISAKTRCNFFRELTHPSGKPKRTWLIIHGLNNDAYSPTSATPALADAIAAKYPNDRVIALDWSEASNNQGRENSVVSIIPTLRPYIPNLRPDSVYYAATWIRPVAEATVKALKEQYGIADAEAKTSLNILGHSLGSLMSAEIGGIYSEGVNSIIALDPPTQETIPQFDGYDLDGRTPGYEIVTKDLGFVPDGIAGKIIKANIESDRPKCFGNGQSDDVKKSGCKQPGKKLAKFTRAFVGSGSVLGNQGYAASADESFQVNFTDVRGDSSRRGLENEHGDVVKTFVNIITQSTFKDFVGLDNLNFHGNIKRGKDGHSGIIRVNPGNIPERILLDHSEKGSLSISSSGKVHDRPIADKIIGSGPSVEEAGSIDSLFPVR